MKKLYDEKTVRDSVYDYLDRTSTIFQCVEDYLNTNYDDIILDAGDKIIASKTKFDFLEKYPYIIHIVTISICAISIFLLIILAIFIDYKIDMAKLNEQSKICVETGYGCTSNTINKDIKYDNTPIVDVKVNNE